MGGKGQTKSRKAGIGKGKVTPVQVAFIVDRYLSDNNFLHTRSSFRSEASHLISKSPVNEAPKSLLSLGDMLHEYICLKEHKVLVAQERSRVDQESLRLQNLLRGMQDLINAYTHPLLQRPPLSAAAAAPTANNNTATPVMMSTSKTLAEPSNFSTPTASTSQSQSQPCLNKRSRNNSKHVPSSKRTRTQPLVKSVKPPPPPPPPPQAASSINQDNTLQITPLPSNTALSPVQVQGSSVAKCLFNPGPQTPSPSPPADHIQTPPSQFTSTVITSETIQVSPMKQVSYYSIETNHCITSPIKTTSKRFRDHVKGRLDFDDTFTSDDNTEESPSQPDAFDFDLPNLDCFGADFNFTDLLGDIDLDATDYFGHPDNGSSPEPLSGSPDTMVDDSAGDHELLSGMSSTLTEIRSEQGINAAVAGPNSVTSVKSITKCIKVFSPVKNRNP